MCAFSSGLIEPNDTRVKMISVDMIAKIAHQIISSNPAHVIGLTKIPPTDNAAPCQKISIILRTFLQLL